MGENRVEYSDEALQRNEPLGEREASDDKDNNTIEKQIRKCREKQLRERESKMQESKSAKEYKAWKTIERYLDQKGKKTRLKTIARCCNEWKDNRYWGEEDKKKSVDYAEREKKLGVMYENSAQK